MPSLAPITYTVKPTNPAAHQFTVTCRIATPDPSGQVLRLPTWIPGSYMIREFSKNILTIDAQSDQGQVPITAHDKCTWRAAPCAGPLIVTVVVYAWDLSVRMAHLDQTHGYFNGTSLFLEVVGQASEPHHVVIDPPDDPMCSGWRVATSLPRAGADPWAFGHYEACSYDDLIDHPVEMGTFDTTSFDVLGVPHHVAITGHHHTDMNRLASDLEPICRSHIQLFGEPAPMKSYLFLVTAVNKGYGGLEHRSSTSLLCARDDLPQHGDADISKGYRKFLGLCSHEYFHTWNIKRIKPAVFSPYDLTREAHTTLLWAFEGITSYYDDLGLIRSGRIHTQDYLELLGQTLTRVTMSRGRHRQSVGQSSFDAWTKFYRQDENARNAIVSYYSKGALVALCLDLLIRTKTNGTRSLDDVMRQLWADWLATQEGIEEGGLEATAAAVSGLDLSPFFNQAVRSCDDLDVAEALRSVGVTLHLRAAESDEDTGGKPAKPRPASHPIKPYLGARLRASGKDVTVVSVDEGGPAMAAGLSAGDVLIACDGFRVNRAGLVRSLDRRKPGDRVSLLGFRRDEQREFTVVLAVPPKTCVYLTLDEEVDEPTLAHRASWLGHTPP